MSDSPYPRILVVEDSPTQAEVIRLHLELAGYVIEFARDGEEGLALFDVGRYDAVISDVLMPGVVDGYELCRRIKSSAAGHGTPVMLLTSLSAPVDVMEGLAAGADSFLTKPYDPVHLVNRLEPLLDGRERRTGPAPEAATDVRFMGRSFTVASSREQVLDFLVATFEDAARQNQELRQRERELSEARAELAGYAETLEARLESILRSVPDVLFSVTADLSSVEYVSPAAAQVTGYEPEDVRLDSGLRRRLVHPDDAPVLTSALARARGGEVSREEFRLTHRDGSERWVNATVVPVRGPTGAVVRLDGIARDVTDARKLHEQFVRAQKMESVGRLARGVAHDFNNLLSVIVGWTGMVLAELPADHPERSSLEEVLSAGQEAAVLTGRLLAFSRQQAVEPTLFSPSELVSDLETMLRRVIGEDVAVTVRADPDVGTVYMDRAQLEQVLTNLAINARDAMPRGGTLTIETANLALTDATEEPWKDAGLKPGPFVRIAVSDSGVGMSAEVMAHLFEPYFTTKEAGKGTGLGLAACHGIITQAGGHIVVRSEPGVGTTVEIYLPHRRDAAEETATLRAEAPVRGVETILLVEDDAAVRRVTARMLETLGYSVVSAASGTEALLMIKTAPAPVHLLLTDVVLPGGMNGPELADRMRAVRPELKVILISGYKSAAPVPVDLSARGVAFLQKPLAAEALGRKVREVLDAR